MDDLPYEENLLDIIWSEGSAFIMGLIPALTYWKKFLKPDGYLVVSDCTWFTDAPSEEYRNFWNEVGPDMKNEKKYCCVDTSNRIFCHQFFPVPCPRIVGSLLYSAFKPDGPLKKEICE